jgi:hypothetical protein
MADTHLTDAELAELLEKAGKAFEGPWVVSDRHEFGNWNVRQDPENWNGMGYQHICSLPVCGGRKSYHGERFQSTAAHIAAFNPVTARRLVEEVQTIRRAVNSFLVEYIVANDTDASIRSLDTAAESLARLILPQD